MEYVDSLDEELHSSLNCLKFHNDGFFKSAKQRDFFKKHSIEALVEQIPVADGQWKISVEGFVRFADYGFKSVRRVEWIFLMDDSGIVDVFKIRFSYSPDGRYSIYKSHESIWKRNPSIQLPVFEEPKVIDSDWIAEVGERLHLKAKITDKRTFDTVFGVGILTSLITEEGNVIKYFNGFKEKETGYWAEAGEVVEFDARIKENSIYKGQKETIITRATKIVIVKE